MTLKKRIISVIYARETDLVKQSLDLLTDPKYKMGIDQGVFVIRAAQSPWPTQTKSPLEANPRFLVIPALENAEGPCIGWDIGLSFAFANLQADYALNLPIDALYLGGDTVKEHLHELVEKADEEDFDLIIGEYDSHPVKDLIEGHVREQLEKLALKNTVNQQVKEQIRLIKRPRSEFFCVKRDFYAKFRKERSVLPFELTVQMLVYMSRRGGRLSSIHMGHYEGRVCMGGRTLSNRCTGRPLRSGMRFCSWI